MRLIPQLSTLSTVLLLTALASTPVSKHLNFKKDKTGDNFGAAIHLCRDITPLRPTRHGAGAEAGARGRHPTILLPRMWRPPFTPRDRHVLVRPGTPIRMLVVGSRIHTIKNLALSSQCIRSWPNNTMTSSWWDSFRWNRLRRFVRLRRVDHFNGDLG